MVALIHIDEIGDSAAVLIQTEAAVMTPAAKPSRGRWKREDGDAERKNTSAAPRVVMAKVNSVPCAAQITDCSIYVSRLF